MLAAAKLTIIAGTPRQKEKKSDFPLGKSLSIYCPIRKGLITAEDQQQPKPYQLRYQ